MMKLTKFTQKIFMQKERNKIEYTDAYDLNYKVDPNFNSIKYIKSTNENKFTSHRYSDSVVRGNYADSLISVIFNTNNIVNTKNIIEKFIKNSKDSSKIQFCIKIDNDDLEFVNGFLKELSNFKAHILVISSPQGRGYIDLWQWINYLYFQSSKKSYFLINISDEVHIDTKNWDVNLENYKHLHKDDIFRLRTSVYKNRNYNNIDECIYAPDTTAIYTRKYIEIQGDFCPCFGPDNSQQIIAFYLSNFNYPRHTQFLRDFVINDINFKGEGTNIGLNTKSLYKRTIINYIFWKWSYKNKNQIEFKKRARKLQISIIKNLINEIIFVHQANKKRYLVLIPGKFSENTDVRESFLSLNYSVGIIPLLIKRYLEVNYIKYHTGYDDSFLSGLICHICFFYLKKHPKETIFVFFTKKYHNIKSEEKIHALNFVKLMIHSVIKPYSLIFKNTSSDYITKIKKSYLKKNILKIIYIYELFIYEIILGTLKFLISFSLSKVFFLRRFFNIFLVFRKEEKYKNISYFQKKSVVLINRDDDQSKSLVIKGGDN